MLPAGTPPFTGLTQNNTMAVRLYHGVIGAGQTAWIGCYYCPLNPKSAVGEKSPAVEESSPAGLFLRLAAPPKIDAT